MSSQQRIYVTLSPRIRKALELCAALDGSTPASYAAVLLNGALMEEIRQHPALQERWVEMEREALLKGSWDAFLLPNQERSDEMTSHVKAIKGWLLSGSHANEYQQGIDEEELYQGKSSGYLRSKGDETSGFGTLMQKFKADVYRGKRLRFSAAVKVEEVENMVGLWMRVDGAKDEVLSFDNMCDRPICGTLDWQKYEVVLDVSQESMYIAFGVLLQGSGLVWINDILLAEVGLEVQVTSNIEAASAPTNLDFADS